MLQDYIDEFLARKWGRGIVYAVGFLALFVLILMAVVYFADAHFTKR
jgi:hypothetical protein